MKIPSRVLPLLLATSILFLCESCQMKTVDGNPIAPPAEGTVIASNVRILDQTIKAQLSQAGSNQDTLHFSGSLAGKNINAGDIIVSDAGEGLLRRVVSIRTAGGETIVATTHASIAEALPTSDFQANFASSAMKGARLLRAAKGVSLAPSSKPNTTNITFAKVVLYDKDGDYTTEDDQMTATGALSLELTLSISWKTGGGKLEKCSIGASLTGTISLRMDAPFEVDMPDALNGTPTLIGTIDLPSEYFMAGILPVVITNQIDVYVGADGSLSAKLTAGITNTTTLAVGANYANGQWTWTKSASNNFTLEPPTLSGDASLKVFAEPTVKMKLYGVVGPTVTIDGYVEGDASGQVNLATGNVDFSAGIYAGVQGRIGVILEVLDKVLASVNSPNLIDYRVTLKEWAWSNSPPNLPSSPTPANNSTGQATNVSLKWVCSDPNGYPLTYDVYFGTQQSSPSLVASGYTSASYPVNALLPATPYYWKIVAKNNHFGSCTGPVWKFITASQNHPPGAPSSPTPNDGGTVSSPQVLLSWVCSDPDGDPLTYNLYFGTSATPPLLSPGLTTSSHQVSLSSTGTYYWQVAASDGRGGVTNGSVWRFTYQAGNTGIRGSVKDAVTQSAIVDVRIDAYSGSTLLNTGYSGSDGTYDIAVGAGTGYRIVFSKSGYLSTEYLNVSVTNAQKTYLETVLQIDVAHSGTGDVAGTIHDAVTNNGVPGMTVKLRNGINVQSGTVVSTATTDGAGGYSFTGLTAGHYTAEVGGTGYTTAYFTVICLGGQLVNGQDATVTPVIPSGQVRIVLTWGLTPGDLDSHLTGPLNDGTRFHMYFWYSGSSTPWPDIVMLDRDDVDSYGPETTTLYTQIQGVYRFSVHDYTDKGSSSSSELSNSGARVVVYRGNAQVATFNVPTNVPGTLWTVFEMSGNTITPVNTMTFESSSSSVQKTSARAEDPSLFRNLLPKR